MMKCFMGYDVSDCFLSSKNGDKAPPFHIFLLFRMLSGEIFDKKPLPFEFWAGFDKTGQIIAKHSKTETYVIDIIGLMK